MAEDHGSWLRRQAGLLRKAAEKAEADGDMKKAQARRGTADRMVKAATALDVALSGADADAMGGHLGLTKRLRPGRRVRVRLVNDASLAGEIRALGRYDFALLIDFDKELVVPKHAVLYWELLEEEGGEDEVG